MSAVTTEAGEKETDRERERERERREETSLLVTRNVAVLANDFGCKYLSEQMHLE